MLSDTGDISRIISSFIARTVRSGAEQVVSRVMRAEIPSLGPVTTEALKLSQWHHTSSRKPNHWMFNGYE